MPKGAHVVAPTGDHLKFIKADLELLRILIRTKHIYKMPFTCSIFVLGMLASLPSRCTLQKPKVLFHHGWSLAVHGSLLLTWVE